MSEKTGNLSINSENIFPIIKKWLYSDRDIFVRELISNGCDALTKLNKLYAIGEAERPEGKKDAVIVIVNDEAHTMQFIDNGIGMTAEEVDEYINQIAFSGASAFLEQYKDKTNEDQIIGHFGLGFYSAFMVADRVTIDSLSYKEGAVPVHWECDGGTEFTMKDGSRTEVGTAITLYLNEAAADFAKEYQARGIIAKYCSFMPYEIFLYTEKQWDEAQVAAETGEEDEAAKNAPKSISDTEPLWTKAPKDCTEEEYKEFYRKVFLDFKEPLFWIHLNMDYPFNLKGILYFPRINNEYESIEGVIKLYNNRVFIADNIKEVIPEFLMLLKGVIDCPDLPLNVSRSALQNDGFVKKVSDYITRKVADRLNSMCTSERETYEGYWDDIGPFVKYGCLRDPKFLERVENSLLFKDLDGKYQKMTELKESIPEKDGKKTILYVTDEVQQGQYIKLYKDAGRNAVILNKNIDIAFITMVEEKDPELKFTRIDSEVGSELKNEQDAEALKADGEKLQALFREKLGKEDLTVLAESMKDTAKAAMITEAEESRRMKEMMRLYGMNDFGKSEETLVLNVGNGLIQFLLEHGDSADAELVCRQIYDTALLSYRGLSAEEMTDYIARTNELLMRIIK